MKLTLDENSLSMVFAFAMKTFGSDYRKYSVYV